MKSSAQIELTAGLFMLLAVAALVFLALQATDRGVAAGESYTVTANFSDIGSLKPRAKVNMAGVTVGTVDGIELDPTTFEARVTLRISENFNELPEDTSASIVTAGILGDQYVSLEPGGSPEILGDGDTILLTNSALVLEQLITRYLFNSDGDEN
ncbi:MAG: outer membrane lipid asymmetry maintenance protein MlaD [Wenzhouxiangella sp.]|jgi:phospholipid/cholesterol/gamma-HCH transport system substrate-binding protein|nr:outer membrane lipid asymmetry maintenance protein MlaD [Wenzhouxiangella sp.]